MRWAESRVGGPSLPDLASPIPRPGQGGTPVGALQGGTAEGLREGGTADLKTDLKNTN